MRRRSFFSLQRSSVIRSFSSSSRIGAPWPIAFRRRLQDRHTKEELPAAPATTACPLFQSIPSVLHKRAASTSEATVLTTLAVELGPISLHPHLPTFRHRPGFVIHLARHWRGAVAIGTRAIRWMDHQVDNGAERRRLNCGVVFAAEAWQRHRSWRRYGRALPLRELSHVVQQTRKPVLAVTAFTFAVCIIQLVTDCVFFHLPIALFGLSGPTLGLLLVFQTNASYERWDSARKMIGTVKNRSEDLIRQASCWFPAHRPDLQQQMLRYTQAFFFALKVHLRIRGTGLEDNGQLMADLEPILTPQELQALQRADNRPAHLLQWMTLVIEQANIGDSRVLRMDQNLTALADVLGGCERILHTPIPLSYTRMTARFLMLWLLLLPFGLSWQIMNLGCTIWLTPPCIMFLAITLLGINEVAIQVEEPFAMLPLESYAEGSRLNTAALIDQLSAIRVVVGRGPNQLMSRSLTPAPLS